MQHADVEFYTGQVIWWVFSKVYIACRLQYIAIPVSTFQRVVFFEN